MVIVGYLVSKSEITINYVSGLTKYGNAAKWNFWLVFAFVGFI